jgi:hypothetical protein
MKRILFLLSASAIAALLVSAPLALARAAEPATIQFDLPADHGLHAQLETFDGEVTLKFERKGRAVSYETAGEATAAGLKVQFGKLGKIDVAFEPTGTIEEGPPKGCSGPPSILGKGDFVGTISFTGERDFVHVEASRVNGILDVEREAEWKCPGRGGPEFRPSAPRRSSVWLERRSEAGSEPATLAAKESGCRCYFAAYARRDRHGRGPTFFVGVRSEEREAMKIVRGTYARAGASTFVFDHAAGTATVRPPAPFSGHASFARHPHSPALWKSTLRIPLLGAEPLSFDGPQVVTRLRRAFPEDD